MSVRRMWGGACAALLLVACGDSEPGPVVQDDADVSVSTDAAVDAAVDTSAVADTADAADVADTAEVADTTPFVWADADLRSRRKYMEKTVKPGMETLFQAFATDGFESFGCATCHGVKVVQGDYDMPSGVITPLSDDVFTSDDPETRRWVEFMSDTVVPEMAAMLGTIPYDPVTQQGLSCFDCHERE